MSATKQQRIYKDHKLIFECVRYAQMVSANEAGFNVDPTGDNEFAGSMGGRYVRSYNKSLNLITRRSATTMEGLLAKSGIVSLVIQAAGGSLDDDDAAFFRSLAADINAIANSILDGEHEKQHREKPQLTVIA